MLPAQTPENIELNRELELLHAGFVECFMEHKQLVEDVAPILTALYLEKLGRYQLMQLERQTELSRIKMKIAMIHAALNRNEQPNMAAIDKEINERLETYYREIAQRSSDLDRANGLLNSLLPEEEVKKLREVFVVLCKRLHPDLNPGQSPEDADLFVKVKAAYDLQQLSELQRILLYLDTEKSSDFLSNSGDTKRERIEHLRKSIDAMQEKIKQLRATFPFDMEPLLKDEEALAQRREEIETMISALEEEIAKQTEILKLVSNE
jgi:hypothetical protein